MQKHINLIIAIFILLFPFYAISQNNEGIDYSLLDDVEFYNPDSGKVVDMGPINTNTVSGFEILYATPGTGDAAEIAGHLVLRVKLDNNPNAIKFKLENPYDLVISFLADTSEGKPNRLPKEKNIKVIPECKKNWFNLVNNQENEDDAFKSILQSLKGLSGGFLTVMDRQTLAYTIKSYTVEQDRDLLRFKLNLTETQKRRLLERLYHAKQNERVKYYFFSQNCASVLIRVIAEGIGNREIANFHPMVSPPNTLLALLLKKRIIEPIYPSFYSSRKKGFISQDLIKKDLKTLKKKYPLYFWPDISDIICKNENLRHMAVYDFIKIAQEHAHLQNSIYKIAILLQEAEMAYSYKDIICENYTSPATAEVRKLQKLILSNQRSDHSQVKMNVDELINTTYTETEKISFSQGHPHTGHYALNLGTGYSHSNLFGDAPVFMAETFLHHQEMGSVSNISMQRSSYVDLGRISLMFDKKNSRRVRLKSISGTGLKIRKFRDRLGRIPSVLGSSGNFGLGLTLLDMEKSYDTKSLNGTIAGVAALFSLYSTFDNNDYLYFSLGTDIFSQNQNKFSDFDSSRRTGITLPLRLENLTTFGSKRRFQLRNEIEYNFSTGKDISDTVSAGSSITLRLNNFNGNEFLVKLQYAYLKQSANSKVPIDIEMELFSIKGILHFW